MSVQRQEAPSSRREWTKTALGAAAAIGLVSVYLGSFPAKHDPTSYDAYREYMIGEGPINNCLADTPYDEANGANLGRGDMDDTNHLLVIPSAASDSPMLRLYFYETTKNGMARNFAAEDADTNAVLAEYSC